MTHQSHLVFMTKFVLANFEFWISHQDILGIPNSTLASNFPVMILIIFKNPSHQFKDFVWFISQTQTVYTKEEGDVLRKIFAKLQIETINRNKYMELNF